MSVRRALLLPPAGTVAPGTYGSSPKVPSVGVGVDGRVISIAERGETCTFIIACSDETTAISAATNKARFRAPFAFTITAVRGSLNGAASTGTFTVDINESGTSILSTKLTFDANEKTTTTAATAAVISDTAIADDAEISIDVDNAGAGDATGLKVTIIGTRV